MGQKSFSEYIEQFPELERAGDGYDGLSSISKKCIDNAVARYAKQQAIAFLKWNEHKISEYLDYLRRVDKAEGVNEKEFQLNHFENGTIASRYEQFIEQQNKEA